ncbi:MAG: ribonucleotide reductase N-terminal alpha domain-containing protein [Euryarchaeota archaeon]|nr:ribonucleotide reductase N-terminal alpha domain-containing protein [Euryarchaeota archaeon]
MKTAVSKISKKNFIGAKDDLKLSLNAVEVLKRRYLLKNELVEVIETPGQMFERVAKAIARAELNYGKSKEGVKEIERRFYQLMRNLEFLPNSPTLMNAGTELGQLAACFVLPVEDSIEGIFGAVKNMALIHKSGGGTGFSFSRLRPKKDVVKSTGGVASGPVSFMRVFDVATDVIKQGGKRRGANMGILNADHPDILEFIRAKERGEFANFNTSVAVTDEFMHAVERNDEYGLVNPRTKGEVRKIKAREVFNEIVTYAWKTGDPGIVFMDEINRRNPIPAIGKIEATNPCVTADTWVMTAEGPRQIEELIGKKFVAIVNGEEWESSEEGFFETGVKQVYRLKTAEGFELRLTADHLVMKVERITRYRVVTQWSNAGDLKPSDKIKMNRERFVATVKEVVPDGIEKVYDVQIPGINAFDANGFIVHNCGEQPLLPYDSCNLGSINVSKFVENGDGEIDWERLREVIWISVRFLDDVIEVNRYPLPEIEKMTRANRKTGLGIMGFAELLIKLGIAYDSKDALSIGEKLMQFITNEARQCSTELGLERGSFPNFKLSVWNSKYEGMRNATVTTIAPTGTISIIGGCSSGIEPIFAVAFVRNVMGGMLEINKLFEEIAKERGFYSKELITEIAKCGSVQDIDGVPGDVKRIFVTALDISPEWHVRMQAAFQKYTDNAVSKTVNLPSDATWGDVKKVFLLAYKLKCKGITIYRYGSKEQVLSLDIPKLMLEEYVCADSEYTGECRVCSV